MSTLRILLPLLALLIALGCGRRQKKVVNDGMYYTCSMHPQVVAQGPGNCPICKMPLIAVRENATSNNGELQLNQRQIQLGNIRVDSARVRTLREELLLAARIVVDERQVSTISTRAMGRVEKLHFKNTGERVAKGQPLFALYSEELNIAVSELLIARDLSRKSDPAAATDPGRLEVIAYNKLLAYGLTRAQVDVLAALVAPPYTVEFLSPVDGVITEVAAREGGTLMQGAIVMKVASLSSVWAEAQVFPVDRARVRPGVECTLTLPAWPDTTITGRIAFANPELDPSSVVGLVRIDLPNPDGRLRPGMQAYVHVPVSEVRASAVPTDAIIRDGRGASVWVSTAPGVFKVVMVTPGIEAGGFTEIIDGLQVGDQVVVSGAYLLNSEYMFRQGDDPMAGMEM